MANYDSTDWLRSRPGLWRSFLPSDLRQEMGAVAVDRAVGVAAGRGGDALWAVARAVAPLPGADPGDGRAAARAVRRRAAPLGQQLAARVDGGRLRRVGSAGRRVRRRPEPQRASGAVRGDGG